MATGVVFYRWARKLLKAMSLGYIISRDKWIFSINHLLEI